MKREMIINELRNRGYVAELTDVIKNGVECHGIIMGNGNIRPTIYVDEYLDYSDDRLYEVVNNVIWTYENSKREPFRVNTQKITDWSYVKNNLQLCLQKKGNEDIVKRNFLDLEQYVRVVVKTNADRSIGSFKIKPEHLKMFGVTKEQLFNAAWDCTKPTIVEEDMVEVMSNIMHMTETEIISMMGDAPRQIVLTNKSKIHGAIAMCDTWLLTEIANKFESDLTILPSSIHEIIVMPIIKETNILILNDMVKEVNKTEVAPEEVLSNHAYIFDRDTREISW